MPRPLPGQELTSPSSDSGIGRDSDEIVDIDPLVAKTPGVQIPIPVGGNVDNIDFRAPPSSSELFAQAIGGVTLTSPEQSSSTAQSFDCYAPVAQSHSYEIGAYFEALKEIEPLAKDNCPQAGHLLAVMFAKGQGVKQDIVRAYALLLVAFSEGVTPFGGGAGMVVLGDDPDEFEIVQFGAHLTEGQLAEAEKLALRLVGPHAIAENGAIGPTGIADAIRELRPRRAGYKLSGKLATLKFADVAPPLRLGMKRSGSDGVPTQLVTDSNKDAIPHELRFIESKMRDIGGGLAGADQELKREIDLATTLGDRIAWLKIGEDVRIVRFAVDASFASQIELATGVGADAAGERYWIDSCFLEMKDAGDERVLQAARGEPCR
jgi:hypothetical protein